MSAAQSITGKYMSNQEIVECKFATYSESNQGGGDIHFVKETVHNPDGTFTPRTRIVKNWTRTFWVTKKGFQNHQEKKEGEKIERVTSYKCTQSQLTNAVKAALGKSWSNERLRDLSASPYLYGTDIDSTALLKQAYQKKYKATQSPFTVAVYDVETDVLHGTEEVIISTLSYKHRVKTVVKASFVEGQVDIINRLQQLAQKYLGDILKERGIIIDFEIAKTELDTAKNSLVKAHEWQPDFVTGWNLLFDMQKVEAAATKAGVDPSTFMNDPKVPQEFRYWKIKEGAAKRVTASGVVHSYIPAQRWHTFYNPASFYLIDAMSTYWYVRQGAQAESSYALEHILNLKIGRGKLKFQEANAYTKLAWHRFMQQHYPLEYVIYNIFDCIGVEMLDEKTRDLEIAVPMYSGISDFRRFNSQPRRKVDDLHFFYQEHGQVFASTGPEMATPEDSEVVSVDNWIITLDATLVADNGLKIIKEDPEMRTNIRGMTADCDITSAYPTNQVCMNVSRQCTKRELLKVGNLDEVTKRKQTLNFSAGFVNATEFCTTVLNLPTLETLKQSFEKELKSI